MIPGKSKVTEQTRRWTGDFGREYTDRNPGTPAEMDELYRRNYGMTRTAINHRFLGEIPRSARILEVGCNVGTQLQLLQQMGFTNLYGIDIQNYALKGAKDRLPEVTFIEGSALAIPYADQFFDLVFTSGVLIHIPPEDLPDALAEIHRCAKHWIWGIEYYSLETTEVEYRGHQGLLWKTDYARLYLQQFPGLELVLNDHLRYLGNDNVDTAFLLRKKELAA
jgi:pseudaminic acid biosynthesis-associated methylase